ncbi:chloride channel protein [Mycobacterium sp. 4D054]|uniref:chloride channel protein n=1 Tax=Mycobacterium sp. 4D054 TaxID=3457440 RepID=UPI003FD204D1
MNRRAVQFGCAVVVVGVIAGMAGAATTLLLHAVEYLTYHYSFGTLLSGIEGSNHIRRAVGPMLGGALAGCGWWALRRRRDRAALTATADAGLQVLLVGSGASLGREGAPRQLASAWSDTAVSRLALTAADRKILLACAAGAGLGAVYSVPLGGAIFAAGIVLRTWHPRALGTALITSSIAVLVAAPVTHLEHPLSWPDARLSYLLGFLALAMAPVAVAAGLAFDRLMHAAPTLKLKSWKVIPGIAAAGLLTGVCSIWLPELPGNGRSILEVSMNTGLTVTSAALILLLKPLLTTLFLRAGAVGGLLTPALATGAAAGSLVALAVNQWTGTQLPVAVVSLSCAAGVLAITQRSPLFAALFVWELARPPLWLLLVFAVGAYAAYVLAVLRRRNEPAAIAEV